MEKYVKVNGKQYELNSYVDFGIEATGAKKYKLEIIYQNDDDYVKIIDDLKVIKTDIEIYEGEMLAVTLTDYKEASEFFINGRGKMIEVFVRQPDLQDKVKELENKIQAIMQAMEV